MGWFRSPVRWPYLLVTVYVAMVILGNAAIFAGVLLARALGHSPEAGDDLPDIENLRKVDEQVYASAQPGAQDYEDLARLGFHLVVDLRSHSRSDPRRDDPQRLEALGLEYLHVPVTDGHAPDEEAVATVLAAIGRAEGKVLLHCGGGVGRSTVLSSAYLASEGEDLSVLDQLGIGPPSLEQIYFVAATDRGVAHVDNGVVNFVSRYIVDGPRRLWHTITGI